MIEWPWDLYARQLLGVLASSASVFLFLALLAFEWMRMETVKSCREVAKELIERNEAIRREQEKKHEGRRKLAGLPPRAVAAVVKKMAR